jgi:hypothetical protein
MWAWTTNVVDPMDHDGWRLVGNDTLCFYRAHGMGRLNALKRHIVNPVVEEDMGMRLLLTRYEGIRSPCRVGRVRRPAMTVSRRANRIALRLLYRSSCFPCLSVEEVVPLVWVRRQAVEGGGSN